MFNVQYEECDFGTIKFHSWAGGSSAQLRAAERETEHMNKISGWRVCLFVCSLLVWLACLFILINLII